MLWFIDVVLVNPATGDLVKKRLQLGVDVDSETPDSYADLATKAFGNALPEMLKEAAKKNPAEPR